MRHAYSCESMADLVKCATSFYDSSCEHYPPMATEELMKIAESAWNTTEAGNNRFGQYGAVFFPTAELATMVCEDSDTYLLLSFLKMHNGPFSRFLIANELAKKFGWGRQRLVAARHRLQELGYIRETKPASYHSPALYCWSG